MGFVSVSKEIVLISNQKQCLVLYHCLPFLKRAMQYDHSEKFFGKYNGIFVYVCVLQGTKMFNRSEIWISMLCLLNIMLKKFQYRKNLYQQNKPFDLFEILPWLMPKKLSPDAKVKRARTLIMSLKIETNGGDTFQSLSPSGIIICAT